MAVRRNPREEDWIFDESLAAINRRLHQELREEAEAVEEIVAESELRSRDFAEVAADARNRGDHVTLASSRRIFTGQVVAAAGNFLTIRTDSYEADVNLADVAFMKVIQRGRGGGRPSDDLPGTFEMRLVERKSAVEQVEVGYRTREETVIGRITTIGQDHIIVHDSQREEWIIPLDSVAFVIRRRRRR